MTTKSIHNFIYVILTFADNSEVIPANTQMIVIPAFIVDML